MLTFNFRYLRCPAAVSIAHLQKLIRAKYDLTDQHRVDVLYNQDSLLAELTLIDIACIYLWKKVSNIYVIIIIVLTFQCFAEGAHGTYISNIRAYGKKAKAGRI